MHPPTRRAMYRAACWLALCLAPAWSACDGGSGAQLRADMAPYATTDSMGVAPHDTASIIVAARPELVESSAATMSATQPGLIFTLNDSGNDPLLFAFDTTGADRGVWRVSRATNVDWESASPGPCAAGDSAEGAASATPREPPRCIYIGDTGDNDAERASRAIYRVPEPAAARAGFTGDVASEKLTYRYADGPHDVEAMYVGPDGAMYFITKRSLKDGAGQRRPALVFRIPASAWRDTTRAVAELVDSLPIIPGSAPFRTITDASLAPDARYLAVRTYLQVYVFATDTATGRAFPSTPPAVCNITGLGDISGEGITWYGSTRRLLLTNEGRREPMRVITCRLPQ
ncbi:MAG: hypothetical protein WKG32_16715 [Gemmatimonadaceae bacterium]